MPVVSYYQGALGREVVLSEKYPILTRKAKEKRHHNSIYRNNVQYKK